MEMPDLSAAETILTAVLAAGVSLLVAFTSNRLEQKKLKVEREVLERQIESSMSTRLFDLRLEVYPRAFEITADLGKAALHGRSHTREEMQETARQLRTWRQGTAALVMSDASFVAYNDLLRTIGRNPAAGAEFTEEQVEAIWKARLAFRGELRRDIGLLEFERRRRAGRAEGAAALDDGSPPPPELST